MPTTIRRILCPTDFSETSRHAVAHATALARWYHASLSLLHVYDSLLASVPDQFTPGGDLTDTELRHVREKLAASCAEATGKGVPVDVLVDTGRPSARILERAAAMPADLIVIGTHGAGGFEHLILGSVAEKVLRKANCAVLTVPPHAERSTIPFKRILCAVDFSEWSLRAFELAKSVARESGAALTALSVIEWPWEEPPAPVFTELPAEEAAALRRYRRQVEESTMRRLKTLADEHAGGIVAEPRISHGKPAAQILHVAAQIDASLIVIGVHGRGALDLGVFGSTTNHVVRQAACPVLTIRG
jgi:nucleotide-binding universal stress UspA family protein